LKLCFTIDIYSNFGFCQAAGSMSGLQLKGEDKGDFILLNGNNDMGLTLNAAHIKFNVVLKE